MKPRTIKYYIKEGFRSVIHNRFMSIASIFAVASSILIVSIFYIIGANIEHFMKQLESQMAMAVRINRNISAAERAELERQLLLLPNVARVTFQSREEALEGMVSTIGEIAVEGLGGVNNPLRDAFFIELTNLSHHDEVLRAIENLEPYGAEQVDSHAKIASALSSFSQITQIISAALMLILSTIAIIIITNTIRITVNARKTEINIMKYVGATDWFIRWPFVIEGMIIGLLGGLGPALISMLSYGRVVEFIQSIPQLSWLEFMPPEQIMAYVFPLSLLLGVAIGLLGSITSVKKHLKV
ncbi:MAG: permease-like cell division protein FtsX [Defluviitaleaceae bacterium]|nr:permease-like cell division protein FtsX [Defluviitaleaceae bacterium]